VTKGLTDKGAVLGFGNITKTKDAPVKFIAYFRFE
jgi:hypothetical protein